ncbi:MAG: DUF1273 domain-containing protein [Clostridiales bacterium]|nr:DUF1273 domain-containing protein [Clostridiales bacterium]
MNSELKYAPESTACFTGHRLIPAAEKDRVIRRLDDAVSRAYRDGYRRFICGGALGFDTMAAQAVIRFRRGHPDVSLVLAVPCAGQADRWSEAEKKTYSDILLEADTVCELSPAYYDGCMLARNQFMVNHSSLCVCYLKHFRGGTGYTVRYAVSRQLKLVNLAMDTLTGPILMKEWSPRNSIFTFPSAPGNAGTVPSYRLKDAKGTCPATSVRYSGRRNKEKH